MTSVLLWLCFLGVLAGLAWSASVLVREARRHVVARAARAADGAEAVEAVEAVEALQPVPAGATPSTQVPAARTSERPALVGQLTGGPAGRRGLGSADGATRSAPPMRPPVGRGLGSSTPVPARAPRSTHRGLGRRPHGG